MFQIQNGPKESGEYAFSGRPIVSATVSGRFTRQEIEQIIEAINDYTQDQLRKQELTIIHKPSGDLLYVNDNLSLKEMDELQILDQENFFLNYFTIVYEEELTIA